MQRRKKKLIGPTRNPRAEVLEASLYNIYWVWSMVALTLLGDPARAQRVIQATARYPTGQERLARKVILKVFTDLAAGPERHLELFLRSAFIYEMQKPATDFSLTKKLLLCLRRQGLLPPADCSVWEWRLNNIQT